MSVYSVFSRTWRLVQSSFKILMKDKELLLFPVLASIGCAAIIIAMGFVLVQDNDYQRMLLEQELLSWIWVWFFYFFNYLIIGFFSGCIVGSAIKRMLGENPSFWDGLAAGLARFPQLCLWAAFSASVGLVLHAVERIRGIGRILAGSLGFLWSVVTYLAIPVIMVEGCGPLKTLRRSTHLLRQSWGEQLVATFSFLGLGWLLVLPILFLAGLLSKAVGSPVVFLVLGAGWAALVGIVLSALSSIFRASLYYFSVLKKAPPGFSEPDIKAAFELKRSF